MLEQICHLVQPYLLLGGPHKSLVCCYAEEIVLLAHKGVEMCVCVCVCVCVNHVV